MKRLNLTATVPLNQDAEGTIRINGSRVTLDTLLAALKRGDTAEQIHDGFPSLTLAQVHSTIAWYLNNQTEANEYLTVRAAEAETLRQLIESQPEYAAFRETMRQRREQLIKS